MNYVWFNTSFFYGKRSNWCPTPRHTTLALPNLRSATNGSFLFLPVGFFQLKQDGVCIFLTVSESISGFSFASASYYARESVKNTILSDVFAKPYECPWPIFSALLLGSWKFGSDIPNHHPFDRIFQNSTPPGLMFLLFLGHIPLLSNTLQNFEEKNRPSNQKVFGQESLRNHTFWFAYCNFPHLWWFISSWSESNSDIFCRWG